MSTNDFKKTSVLPTTSLNSTSLSNVKINWFVLEPVITASGLTTGSFALSASQSATL